MTNGHPTRDEDFDLLALGALDGEEKQALEAHVASCADCARKLAQARGRVALLALGAPQKAPSPAVKQRLMAQIRGAASEPPAPAHASGSRVPLPSSATRWWNAMLLVGGVALAALTIFLWHENRDLARQVGALHASLVQQQHAMHEASEVAELVTSQGTVTVPLAQQPGAPAGAAHVMYNKKMGMLMYEGEIQPAPASKSYQLWVVPENGKPISAGVFNPVEGRPDHWMMKLPEGVDAKSFAVTLEPAGGMPHPTGPTILAGSIS